MDDPDKMTSLAVVAQNAAIEPGCCVLCARWVRRRLGTGEHLWECSTRDDVTSENDSMYRSQHRVRHACSLEPTAQIARKASSALTDRPRDDLRDELGFATHNLKHLSVRLSCSCVMICWAKAILICTGRNRLRSPGACHQYMVAPVGVSRVPDFLLPRHS